LRNEDPTRRRILLVGSASFVTFAGQRYAQHRQEEEYQPHRTQHQRSKARVIERFALETVPEGFAAELEFRH
jgi:hypothetical protein